MKEHFSGVAHSCPVLQCSSHIQQARTDQWNCFFPSDCRSTLSIWGFSYLDIAGLTICCFYVYCWNFYFRAYFICIITSWLFTFDLLGNSCFLSMFCGSGYNAKSFAMYTKMTFQCTFKNDKRILNSLVCIKLLSSCLQLPGFVNIDRGKTGQRFFLFQFFLLWDICSEMPLHYTNLQ